MARADIEPGAAEGRFREIVDALGDLDTPSVMASEKCKVILMLFR